MTEQEYMAAIRRLEIPYGPRWNDRYLMALEANLLMLSPTPDTPYAIWAPWPTADDTYRWPRDSYIVELVSSGLT